MHWCKGWKATPWPWSFDVMHPTKQDRSTSHRLRSAAGTMEMAALYFWCHVGSVADVEWISKPVPNCWTGTGRKWPLVSVLPFLCSGVPKVGWDGKGRNGERGICPTIPRTSLLLTLSFPSQPLAVIWWLSYFIKSSSRLAPCLKGACIRSHCWRN